MIVNVQKRNGYELGMNMSKEDKDKYEDEDIIDYIDIDIDIDIVDIKRKIKNIRYIVLIFKRREYQL